MLGYVYAAIIGMFLFLIIKNSILFFSGKGVKSLYFALFFLCYLVVTIFKAYLTSDTLINHLMYRYIYFVCMVGSSFLYVLIGDRYLENHLLNKITIGYFIGMTVATILFSGFNICGKISDTQLMFLVLLLIFIYSLIMLSFIVYKSVRSKIFSCRMFVFTLLLVCLAVQTFMMALDIPASILFFAGVFVFIIYIEREMTVRKVHFEKNTESKENLKKLLTEVEYKIAEKLIEGKSYKLVSSELNISYYMVNKTASLIYRKVGCQSKTELMCRYK